MVAVVRTMVCADCEELVDVLIGRHGKEGATGDPEYDRVLWICPECHGRKVVAWGASKTCPKCNEPMTKGQMTVLWD